MNRQFITRIVTVLTFLGAISEASAQSTAFTFTYQGRLTEGGNPANGTYDFRFTLFNSAGGADPVGPPITRAGILVNDGLFTVSLDFGAGVFTGPARWLETAVQPNGSPLSTTLTPRTLLAAAPYAIFAGTAATVPLNAISSAQIVTGGVQTSDILDGTIGIADLNMASVDGRYVLKAGDTMTGALSAPRVIAPEIVASSLTNAAGLISIKSRTDIELTIDNGGGAAAAFEIFNGAGNHLFLLSESGNARVFGDSFIDGRLGVGTTTFDANAIAQFNLPSSVSVPHVRIKSPLGNAGFGLQFANPDETWFVGPNIGNWADDRFCLLADSSNKGLIIDKNGNVALDSVSAAAPFATLTIDGTIGFPTVSSPMMYIYPSGTSNAQKPVIVHSPGFPEYGLFYSDAGDRFLMQSSAADTTPSLVVDLDSNWVTIATGTPKPGYALSVNGRVVCEEILVEDSADWPDYVFDENYPLQPLDELEAHIKERKHLPGIPTAAEVERNGIALGDMQKRMMEKIEELTLYVIEQNKKLAAQDERIRHFEAQLSTLNTRP